MSGMFSLRSDGRERAESSEYFRLVRVFLIYLREFEGGLGREGSLRMEVEREWSEKFCCNNWIWSI